MLDDATIEKLVNMESVTQSDDVWKEAPAAAVLLALEVLVRPRDEIVTTMAKEILYRYGNWRSKDLEIIPSVRQEMYQRNYEGEPWKVYYHEDGFE